MLFLIFSPKKFLFKPEFLQIVAKVRSFTSNENISKKVDGPHFEVSAKKASSLTL